MPGLRRIAWALGLAGLAPFVLMTAVLLYAGRSFIAFPYLALALSGYSAVILSFLGGIRWGAALWLRESGGGTLAVAVVTSLTAWVLLLTPSPWGFAGFAIAFLLQGVWDVVASRRGLLPRWFGSLRTILTAVVATCLAASFLAVY